MNPAPFSWHTSSLKLWSKAHANRILTCLKHRVFSTISAMDIAQVETQHLAQLVKAIDDKGVHGVAGCVRQHLTKIMRNAIQQGVIKYNPAYAVHQWSSEYVKISHQMPETLLPTRQDATRPVPRARQNGFTGFLQCHFPNLWILSSGEACT